MARYTVPTVYYQSDINADTAVEVAYIKSLSWANRTNNKASFELIIPTDSSLTPFTPVLGGYIRLSPGDTIMKVEKKERICDAHGNRWYKLGGRGKLLDESDAEYVLNTNSKIIHRSSCREVPSIGIANRAYSNVPRVQGYRDCNTCRPSKDAAQTEAINAQNEGYFFRFVYDGVSEETFVIHHSEEPVTTVNSSDIVESSAYEDNLGGYTKVEIVPVETTEEVDDTIYEEYHWGTIISGNERPTVTRVQRTLQRAYFGFNGWVTATMPYMTDEINANSGHFPRLVYGNENNPNTEWNRIHYGGTWIKSDTTREQFLTHPPISLGPGYTWTPGDFAPIRTITLFTDAEYETLMRRLAPNNPSGYESRKVEHNEIATTETQEVITHVEGGHSGYSCKIKSKGEVDKRYKVDFNLGDTICVSDTRLNVTYTGIVSGAVETIDANGYNVEIEIGTLGATLEQRIDGVI